jgi:hypothetical protein
MLVSFVDLLIRLIRSIASSYRDVVDASKVGDQQQI